MCLKRNAAFACRQYRFVVRLAVSNYTEQRILVRRGRRSRWGLVRGCIIFELFFLLLGISLVILWKPPLTGFVYVTPLDNL